MTDEDQAQVRRLLREELRRCGLMPPRPTFEPFGVRWEWDEAADEWRAVEVT